MPQLFLLHKVGFLNNTFTIISTIISTFTIISTRNAGYELTKLCYGESVGAVKNSYAGCDAGTLKMLITFLSAYSVLATTHTAALCQPFLLFQSMKCVW